MTKMLDAAKAIIKGEAPQSPVGRLIGFDLVSIELGNAVIEFEATESHRNPMGTLHGGILCDIADAAMGMAYASNLNDGESFYDSGTQDQFSEASVERSIDSNRSRSQTGPHGGDA